MNASNAVAPCPPLPAGVAVFSASLYFVNWQFLEVAFRYPKGALDVKTLRRYAAGHTVEVRSTGPHIIIAISVEGDGESFDTADNATGWLSSLIAVRADIASGDGRLLYLGWLLDVQCDKIEDEVVEPGRPEGLGNFIPALENAVMRNRLVNHKGRIVRRFAITGRGDVEEGGPRSTSSARGASTPRRSAARR